MNQQALVPSNKDDKQIEIHQAMPQQMVWMKDFFAQPGNFKAIEVLLPENSPITAAGFVRTFLLACAKNPGLWNVKRDSILQVAQDIATLGLVPGTARQQAALVPFKDKVELIIMKRGYIDLCLRSGLVLAVKALAVFEDEEFGWDEGLDPALTHKPRLDTAGKLKGAYARAHLASGNLVIFDTLRKFQVDRIQTKALARLEDWQVKNSPWTTSPERMAEKSVLKHMILNQTDMDQKLEHAVAVDQDDEYTPPMVVSAGVGDSAELPGGPRRGVQAVLAATTPTATGAFAAAPAGSPVAQVLAEGKKVAEEAEATLAASQVASGGPQEDLTKDAALAEYSKLETELVQAGGHDFARQWAADFPKVTTKTVNNRASVDKARSVVKAALAWLEKEQAQNEREPGADG